MKTFLAISALALLSPVGTRAEQPAAIELTNKSSFTMEASGRNPFVEYQLPEAVIALKQGAGRLIRDVTDRGVLVLCDPRLRTRGYGRVFLDSLPPMPRSNKFADVQTFFTKTANP
jgi:Rad3-related DNA helicase